MSNMCNESLEFLALHITTRHRTTLSALWGALTFLFFFWRSQQAAAWLHSAPVWLNCHLMEPHVTLMQRLAVADSCSTRLSRGNISQLKITARARFLCFSSPLQIVCASLSLSNCSVEKITSAAFQGKHFIKILTRHAKKATAGRIIDLQKQLDAWIHKD